MPLKCADSAFDHSCGGPCPSCVRARRGADGSSGSAEPLDTRFKWSNLSDDGDNLGTKIHLAADQPLTAGDVQPDEPQPDHLPSCPTPSDRRSVVLRLPG